MGRIQVTPNEKYIYLGSQVLKVLGREGGQKFLLVGEGQNIRSFIDLKLLKNSGDIILFDQETSDLVQYDSSLQEIRRLEGRQKIHLDGLKLLTTHYAGDDLLYIWMLGDGSIGLVHPQTMSYDLIEGFFGGRDSSDHILPLTVIASQCARKVLGLYIEHREVQFVFLDGESEFVRKSQDEILGGSKPL